MAYNITYKKSVGKDIARLGKPEARRILDTMERELSAHAGEYPLLKGAFTGLRKLRVGNYRVIFAVFEQEVLILRVGHRRDIYKCS